jgi:hypothetical protein
MKVYILCLMGLVALLEVNALAAMDEPEKLEKKMSSINLSQDKIDELGEQILSGHLTEDIQPYLQGIMDWMQKNMYDGIMGYYSDNHLISIAKDLLSDGAVRLDYGIAKVGKKQENVEYISKIVVVDPEKTKSCLQTLSDEVSQYNKKYPYLED